MPDNLNVDFPALMRSTKPITPTRVESSISVRDMLSTDDLIRECAVVRENDSMTSKALTFASVADSRPRLQDAAARTIAEVTDGGQLRLFDPYNNTKSCVYSGDVACALARWLMDTFGG